MPLFRSSSFLAAWEGMDVSFSKFWLRRLEVLMLFWCPGWKVHRVWPPQVAWYFLGFFMPCSDFHRGSPFIPHPCSSLTHGTGVTTNLCPPGFVSCSFPLTPESHMPRAQACHLHFWHPIKLMAYVLFPRLVPLLGSLVVSSPLPKWHITLDYCLLSGTLALGPWLLTSRCDSLNVPNVTIYRELIRKKSPRCVAKRTGKGSSLARMPLIVPLEHRHFLSLLSFRVH